MRESVSYKITVDEKFTVNCLQIHNLLTNDGKHQIKKM